jgi:mannosidase alpha-like ER degradation enhancer 2
MIRTLILAIVLLVVSAPKSASAQPTGDSVKAQFLHAWKAYKTYAWGHDALRPLSKRPHDWYAHSLLMTPVDAFDTMILMGLTTEAAEAKKLVLERLSFDYDMEVQSFELTIRLLGGLLSAYQLDGDPRFLSLAEDLGKRLLPTFSTPTGMPCRYVNLKTGAIRDSLSNPAEVGTGLLEFGTLSKLTGNPIYYEKAKRAVVEVDRRRSSIGLVGTVINVNTGAWANTESHVGGMIDSYYEYLLKSWKLFGDEDCRAMWERAAGAVNRYVADTVRGELWYGVVDMETGKRVASRFGSLHAFLPAVFVLGGDIERAARLEASCFAMWNLCGIEPEELNYRTMTVESPGYPLRPEIIESAWYLSRATGDGKYRKMGETFYRSIVQYCRTDAGFAQIDDVRTMKKSDAMESFFLAETLKYLYLLLSSSDPVQLEGAVFNTEAHPLRRTWK